MGALGHDGAEVSLPAKIHTVETKNIVHLFCCSRECTAWYPDINLSEAGWSPLHSQRNVRLCMLSIYIIYV